VDRVTVGRIGLRFDRGVGVDKDGEEDEEGDHHGRRLEVDRVSVGSG
jgi:hypothetical protein